MKIAVLGAGAMGSVYGARLAAGGADVTLLDVNDAHLAAVNDAGLHVALDDGERVVRLAAMRPEAFPGGADLVLLFTKVFHTDDALASVRDALGDAFVLSLQNGIGNIERIAATVPIERVLVGVTTTPAEFLGPGRVASHGPALTSLYTADGVARPILKDIDAVMSAGGIEVNLDPDINVAVWEKAAFNCACNALAALTGATPGALGSSRSGRDLVMRIVDEAVAVARGSGVEANGDRIRSVLEHSFANHLYHEPSMLQDRKAGRPTEIDALNGAVVMLGDRLGISVVANRVVAQLVGLMEDAAQFVPKSSD